MLCVSNTSKYGLIQFQENVFNTLQMSPDICTLSTCTLIFLFAMWIKKNQYFIHPSKYHLNQHSRGKVKKIIGVNSIRIQVQSNITKTVLHPISILVRRSNVRGSEDCYKVTSSALTRFDKNNEKRVKHCNPGTYL